MTTKNRVTDTLGIIGAFVANHPEFPPEDIEGNVAKILECLKVNNLEITVANMEKAFAHLRKVLDQLESETPDALKEVKKWPASKIAKAVKEINEMSSDEYKERMKDDDFAIQSEWLLSQPAVKAEAVKPVPKPKFKPPVRTADEQALESMSADAFKAEVAKRGAAVEQILRGQR